MTSNVSTPAQTENFPPEYDEIKIIERPDGFYWLSKGGLETGGPFATLLEAKQDMEYNADSDYEPGETLAEAENEIGISDWIDHDTGQPGEETFRLED